MIGEKASPALSSLILKFAIFLLLFTGCLAPLMAQEAPHYFVIIDYENTKMAHVKPGMASGSFMGVMLPTWCLM